MDASMDIRKWNLCGLMCMHDMARTDMAMALMRFGLSRKTLQRIANMSPNGMLELVQQVGDERLFEQSGEAAPLLERLLEGHSCVHLALALPPAAMAASGLRG